MPTAAQCIAVHRKAPRYDITDVKRSTQQMCNNALKQKMAVFWDVTPCSLV
jgi:hypothetical protein